MITMHVWCQFSKRSRWIQRICWLSSDTCAVCYVEAERKRGNASPITCTLDSSRSAVAKDAALAPIGKTWWGSSCWGAGRTHLWKAEWWKHQIQPLNLLLPRFLIRQMYCESGGRRSLRFMSKTEEEFRNHSTLCRTPRCACGGSHRSSSSASCGTRCRTCAWATFGGRERSSSESFPPQESFEWDLIVRSMEYENLRPHRESGCPPSSRWCAHWRGPLQTRRKKVSINMTDY